MQFTKLWSVLRLEDGSCSQLERRLQHDPRHTVVALIKVNIAIVSAIIFIIVMVILTVLTTTTIIIIITSYMAHSREYAGFASTGNM